MLRPAVHACLVTQVCPTLQPHGLYLARLLCLWDSPGKNTGEGCHALLQGIFPTQGSTPGLFTLLRWQWVLYHQRHLGGPPPPHTSFIFSHKSSNKITSSPFFLNLTTNKRPVNQHSGRLKLTRSFIRAWLLAAPPGIQCWVRTCPPTTSAPSLPHPLLSGVHAPCWFILILSKCGPVLAGRHTGSGGRWKHIHRKGTPCTAIL